jgi:hypothetical protein
MNCQTLHEKLGQLKSVRNQIEQEINTVIQTGDFTNLENLKTQSEILVAEIQEGIHNNPEYQQQQYEKEQQMETLKTKITESMIREWSCDTCETTIIDPLSIDWSQTESTPESITLNPETITMPYNPEKPFIPDLSSFHGKTYTELLTHIQKTYGKTHYLPGLELNDYYTHNPDKIPKKLKDGKYYILPGSSIGDSDGDTRIAYGRWDGSEWRWSWRGNWVGDRFDALDEVVLFER